MNICIKCRHRVLRDPHTSRRYCDYNLLCAAFDDELVPCLDPVLGVEGYSRTNDLGGFIFYEDKGDARPQCRSKNPTGECVRFEER